MRRRTFLGAAAIGAGTVKAEIALADIQAQGRQHGSARQPKRTHVKRGYLDGPYGQIHYYETGSGPTLVLSHQSPVCARMFERALPNLRQAGIRAIAVDTPGYGNSDVPDSPPTIAEYGRAFHAVLDHFDLDQAHFLGHHTGASILCSFAAGNPDRVKSLILNGPPLLSAEQLKAARERISPGPHPIHDDGSHLQARWDRRTRFTPGWSDKVAMHRRLVDQLWAGPTAWYGHRAALSYEMADDFQALRGPVMILTNTGDDIYDLARKAHGLRPEFTYRELRGGTHDIVDEQPQAWSQAVAEYVLAQT